MKKSSFYNIHEDLFGRNKKASINSDTKGKANERVACKDFLLPWTGQEFGRVPNSGGLKGWNDPYFCGDVVCKNREFDFPFTIETKHRKDIRITYSLRANSYIFTVMRQCLKDCERSGKDPMLLMRPNGMRVGNYIVYVQAQLSLIPKKSYGYAKDVGWIFGYHSSDLLIFGYEDFLELYKNTLLLSHDK